MPKTVCPATSVLFGAEAEIFALQKQVDFAKAGPLGLHLVPALGNEPVDVSGAVVGLGQGGGEPARLVEGRDVGEDLLLAQGLVGLLPRKGQDLPEGHAERPHVALGRVFALQVKKYE